MHTIFYVAYIGATVPPAITKSSPRSLLELRIWLGITLDLHFFIRACLRLGLEIGFSLHFLVHDSFAMADRSGQ